MKQSQEFEFKYQGENFIDLNTLITSQFHFLAAVNELQRELYPDANVKLRVGAFKEGSFLVEFLLETTWIDNMFNRDNINLLIGVIGGFASLISIHKYLNGRKATTIKEKGDDIEIETDGETPITINKQVFNIYKENATVNKALRQNFELLEKDNEIEGVEILTREKKGSKSKSKRILEVVRDDFETLSKENPYLERTTTEEVHRNQTLFIKKPNLYPEKNRVWNWGFIHKGRDIKAKIVDNAFRNEINSGLRLGQGDRLEADLKIYYKWDERFRTFIESNRYEVVKVYNMIKRTEQTRLDFIRDNRLDQDDE